MFEANKTVFYRIYCCKKSCNEVFVGHTTNLSKKKHFHKTNSSNPKKTCSLYTTIRKQGGWDNWKMEAISSVHDAHQEQIDETIDKYIEEYQSTLSTIEQTPHYKCEKCNLDFKDNFNLEKHYRTKKHMRNAGVPKIDNDIVMGLISQTGQLTQKVMELAQKDTNTNCNNTNTITNNTTNNTINKFNLNVFLNEKCKNAININDFINQLVLKISDLEQTGELGFASGISRILTNGMMMLDTEQRPIHCSDSKRNTLYIKNENGWNNDSDRKIIEKAICDTARKNIHLLPQWQEKNPRYYEYDSAENTTYMRILGNAMVGGTDEEIERNFKKIVHNIAQESVIPKYMT
jgi:hypothetical protein